MKLVFDYGKHGIRSFRKDAVAPEETEYKKHESVEPVISDEFEDDFFPEEEAGDEEE